MFLTAKVFLIVIPLVFLAGLVDAIGGGGGLISLPAYLLAGLPTHMAIATNKLSSACGTSVATAKFIKEKQMNLLLAVPTVICAFAGSFLGAKLSLRTDESKLQLIMIPVLFLAAFFVLNRKMFASRGSETTVIDRRVYIVASLASFIIGIYDGFYGPGTGTFLIIALTVFGRLAPKKSNAQAKIINLTTNLTSLVVFIMGGQVVWTLGIAAALSNMAGGYIGSVLALSKGEKIIRPVILVVLVLLAVKILTGY